VEIEYINFVDGRHDVFTWGRAMPKFLMWGWGKGSLGNNGNGSKN
jgi:hypothetical protein